MSDILTKIIEKRKNDIEKLGISFGFEIPSQRSRPLHKFLDGMDGTKSRGVILEVKRASPSKGEIAPELDAALTARSYAEAGAAAISCLTETNYFKGTLGDLMNVCAAIDSFEKERGLTGPAILRKDFLLSAEEVDVAFRAGADAVLLIARILPEESLLQMAERVVQLGMNALVEVRSDEDIKKIEKVFNHPDLQVHTGLNGSFVFGVNSRDLSNFKIDLLHPAIMKEKIREAVAKDGKDIRIIFESGVTNKECADSVGSMGFSGLLLGEAAAKNPELRSGLVSAFTKASPSKNSAFWNEYAANLGFCKKNKVLEGKGNPLVKICGLTRIEDALASQKLGADFLGFIFCRRFPPKFIPGKPTGKNPYPDK